MSFLRHIFTGKREREAYRPLYNAIVNVARDRVWFTEGQVPDTIDGRFDMIAAVLALTLIRLEREEALRAASVHLTEVFIDDMEGTIRELGIGDVVVGKHVGKLMGALGGRLAAFRAGIEAEAAFRDAVRRNVFRDVPPSENALNAVSGRLRRLHDALRHSPGGEIVAGRIPSA